MPRLAAWGLVAESLHNSSRSQVRSSSEMGCFCIDMSMPGNLMEIKVRFGCSVMVILDPIDFSLDGVQGEQGSQEAAHNVRPFEKPPSPFGGESCNNQARNTTARCLMEGGG